MGSCPELSVFCYRACIGEALKGCSLLVDPLRSKDFSPASEDVTTALAFKLLREVPIASLGQETRHSCLKLLLILTEVVFASVIKPFQCCRFGSGPSTSVLLGTFVAPSKCLADYRLHKIFTA